MSLNTKQIIYLLWAIFAVLALFFVSLSLYFFKKADILGADIKPQATIVVKGEGKVVAIPNTITTQFTIEEKSKDAFDAQQKLAEKSSQIISVLQKEFGIKKENIKTLNYNINPYYEWVNCSPADDKCIPKREQKGYKATQVVKVKIKDQKIAGKLLTKLTELGANSVGSLRFEIEDQKQLEQEARELAIKDAKQKAQKLAGSLGVRLVRIISYSDSSTRMNYAYSKHSIRLLSADAAAAEEFISPEIPVGENEIKSYVTIEYEIR